GRSRWARSAPARASGLWSGSDGRACISSMATLLFGSSLACVQTTPIASSRSAFASGDNEACARDGFVWEKAGDMQMRISDVKKRFLTQRRKDAKKTQSSRFFFAVLLCVFASLRE